MMDGTEALLAQVREQDLTVGGTLLWQQVECDPLTPS